jgi:hypothetical protein
MAETTKSVMVRRWLSAARLSIECKWEVILTVRQAEVIALSMTLSPIEIKRQYAERYAGHKY